MKINFSKKEYRLLMDIVYLSEWMMNAHDSDPVQENNPYTALRKKLMSYYKEMDAEDIIEYNEKFDDYFELNEYDETLQEKFIKPYDEATFWEELLEQLSHRDLVKTIGEEKYKALEFMEKAKQLITIREFYEHEFEKNGLARLEIRKGNLIKH